MVGRYGGSMNRVSLTLFALALLSPSFTACEKQKEETARISGPSHQVGSGDLENSIRSRFAADEQLRTAKLRVDADKEKQVVTISGTVDSERLRAKALDLARRAQPQLTILDQINITPAEVRRDDFPEQMAREEWVKAKHFDKTAGNRLDDAWIYGKIVAKLISASQASPRTVSVDVTNNVVTLRGNVQNITQKAEAERIARETEGVKRVENQLKINA
jgi:osmotically-inducible protein OsmY